MNIRYFCSAIATILVLSSASAQRYQMGFTGGSNYSNLNSDLFTTSSGRLSGVIGCSFVIGLSQKFELNQEISFVQKGATAKTAFFRPEQAPDIRSYQYNYNSFEAGLFLGYQPVMSLPIRIQAGAFYGTHFHNLNRSQRDLYLGNYEDLNQATKAVDLNDAFSGVDAGPAIGISGGDGQFRVNARYYYGMRNLYNNLDFVEGGHRIRTNSIRLTLTFFLK
jgi:hypothetical protein